MFCTCTAQAKKLLRESGMRYVYVRVHSALNVYNMASHPPLLSSVLSICSLLE